MVATIVFVDVKPEFIEQFREASLENHRNSRLEKGNIRFDVLQDDADPTKFMLYEVFDSEESVKAPKDTAHYMKWRDPVAPFMNSPRKAIKTTPSAFN